MIGDLPIPQAFKPDPNPHSKILFCININTSLQSKSLSNLSLSLVVPPKCTFERTTSFALCLYSFTVSVPKANAELPTSTNFTYFVRKFVQNTAVWTCPNNYGILKNNHTECSKTMNPDKHGKTHSFTPNPGTILSGPHTHALTFKQRMQRGCRGERTACGTSCSFVALHSMHACIQAHVQCMYTRPSIKI